MKLFKRRPKPENSARAESADSDASIETDAAAAEPNAGRCCRSTRLRLDCRISTRRGIRRGFGRLRKGLSRSRDQFTEGLASLVLGKKQLDPDFAGGP